MKKKLLPFIFGDDRNIELRLALLLAGNVYTEWGIKISHLCPTLYTLIRASVLSS